MHGHPTHQRSFSHWTTLLVAIPLSLLVPCRSASAQSPTLTVKQAQQIALANRPRLLAANLVAEATLSVAKQARSVYWPTLSANLTSVRAQEDATVAAGALTTSSLANRFAGGVVASHLVTDFGRASNLTGAANLRADAQRRQVEDVRAQVLLEVAQTYYQVLAAEAVVQAARADLDNRRLLLRQVSALAKGEIKSTLDVSFAEVAVSEAELAFARAENGLAAARAQLSAALGGHPADQYDLVDDPVPPPADQNVQALIDRARANRPDLAALQSSSDAAVRLANAERALWFPAVTIQAVAGVIPTHDERLPNRYNAAGINISVPLFNGGLFAARRTEADLRAQAAAKDAEERTLIIDRDVRVAWLNSTNALERLDVTARLVEQATRTLRLAQRRYELGLSSIVELNQAQLSQTSALMSAATAKYDYMTSRAALDYAVGALR